MATPAEIAAAEAAAADIQRASGSIIQDSLIVGTQYHIGPDSQMTDGETNGRLLMSANFSEDDSMPDIGLSGDATRVNVAEEVAKRAIYLATSKLNFKRPGTRMKAARNMRGTIRTKITSLIKGIKAKMADNPTSAAVSKQEVKEVQAMATQLQRFTLDESALTMLVRKDMLPENLQGDRAGRNDRINEAAEAIGMIKVWYQGDRESEFLDRSQLTDEEEEGAYDRQVLSIDPFTVQFAPDPQASSTRAGTAAQVGSQEDRQEMLERTIATLVDRLPTLGTGGVDLSQSFDRLAETLTMSQRTTGPNEKVPKFGGDLAAFATYWQAFISLVEENPRLSTIVKFNRLKQSLEGEAKEVVDAYEFVESNYDNAKAALINRFGDEQLAYNRLQMDLQNMERVRNNDTKALRNLYNKANQLIRKTLKLYPSMRSSPLPIVSTIENKMSQDCSEAWEAEKARNKRMGNKIAQEALFSYLLDWLNDFVTGQEKTHARKDIESSASSQKKTTGTAVGQRPRTLNNFMAIDGLQSNTGEIRCHFCGGNHLTARCRSDRTTPLQRRDKAMKAGLCLNCLQEGHFSRNCRLPKGCSRQGCGKRHHTLLHSTQANGGTSRPYGQGRPRQ